MNEKKYSIIENLKNDWPIIILLIANLIFSFYAYPLLPDKIPTHWNIQGEVDGWSSKEFGVIFFPIFTLGIWFLLLVTPLIDPKKANYNQFINSYKWIRLSIVLIIGSLGIITLLVPLGYNIDVGKVVTLEISLLFIIIGNFLGKIKHNYFLGIRTPWTLASEIVWRKTHRIAGLLWVGAGLIGLFSIFLVPKIRFLLFIGSILTATIFSLVYSFILFNKLAKTDD